jgi:hypothetical protein
MPEKLVERLLQCEWERESLTVLGAEKRAINWNVISIPAHAVCGDRARPVALFLAENAVELLGLVQDATERLVPLLKP